MQFTYTYLKNAEKNGVMVGSYKGYDVVPIAKETLARNGEDDNYIYLIYDDNNLLYRNGKVFGSVDKNGNVEEFTARRYLLYNKRNEEVKEIPRAKTPKEAPAADISTSTSGIVGDAVLEILVENTLIGARTMSIDRLLEGFNYGLE